MKKGQWLGRLFGPKSATTHNSPQGHTRLRQEKKGVALEERAVQEGCRVKISQLA